MILQVIEKEKVKKVVLSAKWSLYLTETYHGDQGFLISDKRQGPFATEIRANVFERSLNDTINKLKKLNVEIHILGQPPTQYTDAESIYFKKAKSFGSLDSFSVKRKDFEKLTELQDKFFYASEPDLHYHSLLNLFCDKDICRVGTKDYSYYYDDDHLSNKGVEKVKKLLETILI